jgi:NADH:ubiquinone reductase (H+-translocating)
MTGAGEGRAMPMTDHAGGSTRAPETSGRHQVLVVGGGFGGVNVAKALADADVDVTIADRTNHHLFQPLLYQVAAGLLSEGLIAPPLRRVIKNQGNARAVLADVTHFDLDQHFVYGVTPDGRRLHRRYDTLVVAGGATHAYFGNDHWGLFAPGMKTLEDARKLRGRILSAFEVAETVPDPALRKALLTFVVVGAGPTGVELVGQVAELAKRVLPREYRWVDTATEIRVILVEAGPAVLGPFHPKLQRYARRHLVELGVEVRTDTMATDMDSDGITLKTAAGVETIPARTKIWAAGVQASPLARMLAEATGAQTDRAGRVVVRPDCTLPGHPEVFAIGDMVSLNKLPGVAQPAIQEGQYVGKVIKARLQGAGNVPAFRYFDKGSMATIGYRAAVADAFGIRFTGSAGYLMWGFVHVFYLIGWGNRLSTMLVWLRSLVLTKNYPQRIIGLEQPQAVDGAVDGAADNPRT